MKKNSYYTMFDINDDNKKSFYSNYEKSSAQTFQLKQKDNSGI